MNAERQPTRAIHRLGIVAVALGMTACASTPNHQATLDGAETAVTEAREVRAEKWAEAELVQAQQKLAAAHTAKEQGYHHKAQRLADEAQAHAELAETRAMLLSARQTLEELQQGLDSLEREIIQN